MKKRVTKTSEGGAPLWRCDRCHAWLLREDFAQRDVRRGYICNACHGVESDSVRSVLSLAFLTASRPPISIPLMRQRFLAELNRARKQRRQPLIKRAHARPVLKILFNQSTELPPDWRPVVWQLLADPGPLRARAVLWLGFRYGALTETQQRRVALSWARLASDYVSLCDETDVSLTYTELEKVAETGRVTPEATQATYDLLARLRSADEYVARSRQLAGMALSAVLLPQGRDAMLGAGSWAYNAIKLIPGAVPTQTFTEFGALLGQAVEPELEKKVPIEKLEHWTGLESL